jgi:hypothetical protein
MTKQNFKKDCDEGQPVPAPRQGRCSPKMSLPVVEPVQTATMEDALLGSWKLTGDFLKTGKQFPAKYQIT